MNALLAQEKGRGLEERKICMSVPPRRLKQKTSILLKTRRGRERELVMVCDDSPANGQ